MRSEGCGISEGCSNDQAVASTVEKDDKATAAVIVVVLSGLACMGAACTSPLTFAKKPQPQPQPQPEPQLQPWEATHRSAAENTNRCGQRCDDVCEEEPRNCFGLDQDRLEMLRRKVGQVVARVVEGLLLPQSGYEVVIYVQPFALA